MCTVLVDKGYHNGRKLQCINNNITTIVAITPGTSKESVTQPDYLVANLNTMQKMTAIHAPKEKL
jgi:hypothetical protein